LKLFFPEIASSSEVGYSERDPAFSAARCVVAVKFLFAAIRSGDFMTLKNFGRYTGISGEQ
jgi:hypothetical protein